ncbi:MAG TPA: DUF4019 domain-containing protein [Thermoanaerobaculia bacterium]|nr:DUF4019 domain-containing protein [Thermoanaerobaculia bacterium]
MAMSMGMMTAAPPLVLALLLQVATPGTAPTPPAAPAASTPPAAPADKEAAAKAAARRAAEAWLVVVDKGDYAGSWDSTSSVLQKAYPRKTWARLLEEMRKPVGAVQSRVFKEADHGIDPPGAPRGEYVSIRFTTTFKNRKSSTETVTPKLEGGVWRVSGYFIK